MATENELTYTPVYYPGRLSDVEHPVEAGDNDGAVIRPVHVIAKSTTSEDGEPEETPGSQQVEGGDAGPPSGLWATAGLIEDHLGSLADSVDLSPTQHTFVTLYLSRLRRLLALHDSVARQESALRVVHLGVLRERTVFLEKQRAIEARCQQGDPPSAVADMVHELLRGDAR